MPKKTKQATKYGSKRQNLYPLGSEQNFFGAC
jgi:hypothetical protein